MTNVWVVQGRLTKDPELRYTQNNTPVCSFSVACQRNRKAQNDKDYPVDFIDCVAWRHTAEFINQYFGKGSMIIVNGAGQRRTWTDKEGNKRNVTELLVDDASFCGKKSDNGFNNGPAPSDVPADDFFEGDELDNGDLPF